MATAVIACVAKICRRRTTIFGILLCLSLFALGVHLSARSPSLASPRGRSSVSVWTEVREDEDGPHVSFRKKLEESPRHGEPPSFSEDLGPQAHKANDIPDYPQKAHFGDGEEDYYKKRNKAMFAAEARARSRGKPKYSAVPQYQQGQYQQAQYQAPRYNVQPAGDANADYAGANAPAAMSVELQAPLFRSDLTKSRPAVHGAAPLTRDGSTPSKALTLYVPRERLVHLDLKGAPPKVDYLLRVLRIARQLGATGVILEYEDMFPFEGRLAAVTAKNHYTREEVQALVEACYQMKLNVIPLVQTFGHLEFALKLSDFAHLRDTPEMPESLCACSDEAFELVRDLVDQVAAMHPKSTHMHIGCDEVYHVGECQPCREAQLSRSGIFVSHTARVAKHVKEHHKLQPIIWDDMLRNLMTTEMEPLANLVEPMVWDYTEDIYRFIPSYTWDRLSEVFPTVWAASAYKGAHGPTLIVPNAARHLDNTLGWLDVMNAEESKFKNGFRGLALTGWQRYDHFAVLCELLPAAVPSLAIDLAAATRGAFDSTALTSVNKALECVGTQRNLMEPIDFDADPYLFDRMAWCYFPGVGVYKAVRNLINTQKDVKDFVSKATVEKGWLTDYNVRRNFSTPMRLAEVTEDWSRVYSMVINLARNAKQALSEAFDMTTVSEWLEQKLYPLYEQMRDVKANADALKVRKTWPARPFPQLSHLAVFGLDDVDAAAAANNSPKQAIRGQSNSLVEEGFAVGTNEVFPGSDVAAGAEKRPRRIVQGPDYYRHPKGSR